MKAPYSSKIKYYIALNYIQSTGINASFSLQTFAFI